MLDETRVETSVLYNILPVMSKSGTDRVYIHWGERAGDHKGPLRHSSPHSPLREPNFPRSSSGPCVAQMGPHHTRPYGSRISPDHRVGRVWPRWGLTTLAPTGAEFPPPWELIPIINGCGITVFFHTETA